MAKKELMVAQSRRGLERFKHANPEIPPEAIERRYVLNQLMAWLDGPDARKPFPYPLADMAEAGKQITCLNDLSHMDTEHVANLYMRVSLRGVDRFFMQVRRRLSILERPIATANNARRSWHGYSAYSPLVAERVLKIFRAYYNYALVGEDGSTPAMRLGLIDHALPLSELANFVRPAGSK